MLARCTHTLIISHIHTPITCTSSLVHIPQSHVSHTHTQSHVLSYTYPITYPLSYTYPNCILYLSYTYPITYPLSYTYPITCPLIHIPNHMSSHTHTQPHILSHTHTQSRVLSYTYPTTCPLSYTYPNHILYLSYTYPITYPLIHIPNHMSGLSYIYLSYIPTSPHTPITSQSIPIMHNLIASSPISYYYVYIFSSVKAIGSDHMWSEEKSA